MSARLVWAYATYRCLHLRLQWDLVVHLGRVYVCFQGKTRGVWILPLIEGLELPPDILHIRPGGVWRPHRRMPILTFQYGA